MDDYLVTLKRAEEQGRGGLEKQVITVLEKGAPVLPFMLEMPVDESIRFLEL